MAAIYTVSITLRAQASGCGSRCAQTGAVVCSVCLLQVSADPGCSGDAELLCSCSFDSANRPPGKATATGRASFGATSGRLPTSPPTPSPSASATNEPHDQQQYQRADGGVELVIAAIMPEPRWMPTLRQQPTTNEGAYNSNDEIADDPKPGALHDLAGQPSGNEADP